jgi:uncharacterized protein DUF3667
MEERPATNSTAQSAGPQWLCVTCGRQASGNFCAHCGEKRQQDHDFSLLHVLSEAVEAFFHVDSKVFRTLKTLAFEPGKLAEEFFLGRRKPYMSPLQTFFVCNLLFFVLQPLTGLEILAPPLRAFESNTLLNPTATRLVDRRLEKEHISRNNEQQFSEFTAHFDRVSRLQAKSLILILSPMLASVLAVLNFRRRRYFSEHLIFSLQVYAWWLLWLLLILVLLSLTLLLTRVAGHPMNLQHLDIYATLLEFGGLGVYMFFASRRFYKDALLAGLMKGGVLTIGAFGLFQLYRALLLFTVVYSI